MKLPPILAACALAHIAALATPGPAHAAPGDEATATPAAAPAATVVAATRQILRDRYVLPEIANALDKALADAERAGTFSGLAGQQLADAIQNTLRTVTPDGHLKITYDPGRAAQLAATPAQAETDDEVASPDLARMIALNNAGVRKLEVLPGNIRYMEYTGFMWGAPVAQQALAQAMEFLAGGSAVIIDIRRNGGGSPGAVAYLASHFLPAGTPLMRFEMRGEEPSRTATAAVPVSLAGKPAYVLASKRSFSAAEEFAAHVDAFGFAKLVGETTGGGGFRNEFFALPGGLVISVSTGQAIQAKTGKGWERVGIAPSIAVAQDRALDAAMADALGVLADRSEGGEKAALATAAPYYAARVADLAPARPPADYVGSYGPLTVSLAADGRLSATAPTGPAVLVPLGGNAFAPEGQPMLRIEFASENDRIVSASLATPNGVRTFPRR